MTKQLDSIVSARVVDDLALDYRQICRVRFEGSPTWWPVLLSDVASILEALGMIDGYDSEKQMVWVEQEVDSRFDRARNQYEPIFATRSQDIRDFLRECDWSDYNRIFATAGV